MNRLIGAAVLGAALVATACTTTAEPVNDFETVTITIY